MRITDLQVEAMRAFLQGNEEESARLHRSVADSDDMHGTGYLLFSALNLAVRRAFRGRPEAEMEQFIDNLYTITRESPELFDPEVAELQVRAAMGESVVDHSTNDTRGRAQSILLAILVHNAKLDDAGLDQFLAEAREHADRLISGQLH